MALKKPTIKRRHFSYKWRLLLPTLGLMWVAIISLTFFQYWREEQIRLNGIRSSLDMTNNRVIDAYLSGTDVPQFVEFLGQLYVNSTYDGICVSVYDYAGNLIASTGTPIDFKLERFRNVKRETAEPAVLEEFSGHGGDEMFYYVSQKSADGKVYVMTAMPYTRTIDATMARGNRVWWIMLPILLLASIAVYFFVDHLTRSVKLLARFSEKAAEGDESEFDEEFPHNEFGNIAKQIVTVYRQKADAMKESEQEHRVAMNAILEKSRMKREMSNNINHELKTPVGIIKGYIDTILAQPDMDIDTMRHFVERAHTNVERLVELVNSLSIVTRLEDGATQITFTKVDFHDLVYSIDDDLRQSGVLKGMKFSFNLPLNCNVHANANLLNSMLYNLIRNSVRHSKGTGMWIDLVSENDKYYTFRFYDDGVGVPPESLGRLFDRFYRIDSGRSRKFGDSGLGLPIVKGAVESMGGAISVKNRSTGGLEYIFTLKKWVNANKG